MALPPILIIPALTYAISSSQSAQYQAGAQVLLNRQDVVSAAAQVNNPILFADPSRLGLTQADVARSPLLARRVVAAARIRGLSARGFLASSHVSASPTADVLEFSVTGRDPALVTRLVNVYANQYAVFSREIQSTALESGVKRLQTRISALAKNGGVGTTLYKQLVAAETKLETAAALETGNSVVLRPAEGAGQIAPRPGRNALLGLLVAIVLGIGFSFLAEALDKRIRNEDEIEEALGVPLLARIAEPSRELRQSNQLVMVSEPSTADAEAFRKLRGTLEFVKFQHRAAVRTIMITSAGQREGKSTTIGNLAVALARAGRRIALVDLDLRRPFLHTLLGVDGSRGFADVAVGRIPFEQAMRALPLPLGPAARGGRRNGAGRREISTSNGRREGAAMLHFLPTGTTPPAVGEFLLDERVPQLLADLRDRFDLVLVDAPPLTVVSDAATLSGAVDAIVLAVPLGIRRPLLHELAREIGNCRAPVVGFVLTGAQRGDRYSGEYGGYFPPSVRRVERAEQAR